MDATAWAVVTILIAIGETFRSVRSDMRVFREHVDQRIDSQGHLLQERIDTQGEQLRDRIDAQGKETSDQIGQLRERMAKLEGLRETVTGKRAAQDATKARPASLEDRQGACFPPP